MSTSAQVVAGSNATAQQHNDLRTDAIRRDAFYTFEQKDPLAVLDSQGGAYLVPLAMTIYKVKVWVESGSCTIRIKTQSGNILASQVVTTTPTDITVGFTSTALAENDRLTLDIIGNSSGNHLIAVVFATRNL